VFKKRRTGIEKDLVRMGKDQSKWAPNYKQPYMVKNAFFSGGALILTIIDGKDLSRPINFDIVKKYYV